MLVVASHFCPYCAIYRQQAEIGSTLKGINATDRVWRRRNATYDLELHD